jgi:hypothetical protein
MKHDAEIAGPHNVKVGDLIRYQYADHDGTITTVLINSIYRRKYRGICINSDDEYGRNREIAEDNLKYWRKI